MPSELDAFLEAPTTEDVAGRGGDGPLTRAGLGWSCPSRLVTLAGPALPSPSFLACRGYKRPPYWALNTSLGSLGRSSHHTDPGALRATRSGQAGALRGAGARKLQPGA